MRYALAMLSLVCALASGPLAAQENGGDEVYRLSPGDVINVSVLEDPSLDREILIQPDGRVALPLAGAVMAGGRTPSEVADVLRERLADDFVAPPTVTVSLSQQSATERERARPTIYVIGQVNNPGRFEVLEPLTALQALALAGGPGVFAATQRIQIRDQTIGGADTVRVFDYEAIEDGIPVGESIEVGDGDVIVVPEAGLFE